MLRKQYTVNPSRSRGLSLLELMIGMTIGLFITAVAITYMVSSSRAFRTQDDEGRIQENARFSLDFLTYNIRLAGFDTRGNFEQTNSGFDPFYAGADCPKQNGSSGTEACTIDDGGLYGSDRIAIQLMTRARADGTSPRGCSGATVAAGTRIINVFWVASDNGLASLYCGTYTINPASGAIATTVDAGTPLVGGIDSMQVQYGEDTNDDNIVDKYVAAKNVTDMARVLSVRIALLGNSGLQQKNEKEEERKFYLLDGPEIAITDTSLHQMYSTTIMLPNANKIVWE